MGKQCGHKSGLWRCVAEPGHDGGHDMKPVHDPVDSDDKPTPARCKNTNCKREHVHVRIRSGWAIDDVIVIGRGRRAYVWLGNENKCIGHFTGPTALRRLREAIDQALGDRPTHATSKKGEATE